MPSFFVWITGYVGSGVRVQARGWRDAATLGALTQMASHHGEIVEINIRHCVGPLAQLGREEWRRFVRLNRNGQIVEVTK